MDSVDEVFNTKGLHAVAFWLLSIQARLPKLLEEGLPLTVSMTVGAEERAKIAQGLVEAHLIQMDLVLAEREIRTYLQSVVEFLAANAQAERERGT